MGLPPLARYSPFIVAVIALCVYVYRRLLPITHTRAQRLCLACVLALGPLLASLSRIVARVGGGSLTIGKVMGFIGHGISLVIIFCAAVALVVDAARVFVRVARTLRRAQPAAEAVPVDAPASDAETPARSMSRRDFVERAATWSVLAASTTATTYGMFVGRTDRVIDEVSFALPRLPRTRDGYVIAQLSDVHFGQYVGEAELRQALDLVARARPDLVVLTGDLVDHDPRFAPLLGRLVRALEGRVRDGVVAIPGNHDYYAGLEVVRDAIARGGGRMLQNSALHVGEGADGFALLGVDDVWGARDRGARADVHAALAFVPEDRARVLLCHNPVYFPEAADHVDLMLAGHTHGGQIGLGGHPADLVLPYGYVRGTYTRGDAKLYVNRGFGTAGPPARLGSAPEVTRIVLTRG